MDIRIEIKHGNSVFKIMKNEDDEFNAVSIKENGEEEEVFEGANAYECFKHNKQPYCYYQTISQCKDYMKDKNKLNHCIKLNDDGTIIKVDFITDAALSGEACNAYKVHILGIDILGITT